MASLLILLASPTTPGLQPVAQSIITRWEEIPRHDLLAMVFYAILVDYSIDTKTVCLLQARAFVAQGMFEQAEQLLHCSQALQTSPDALWLLVSMQQQLSRSPQMQLETLQHFIVCAQPDPRVTHAWITIGDIYGTQLGDGMAAIRAYERA